MTDDPKPLEKRLELVHRSWKRAVAFEEAYPITQRAGFTALMLMPEINREDQVIAQQYCEAREAALLRVVREEIADLKRRTTLLEEAK